MGCTLKHNVFFSLFVELRVFSFQPVFCLGVSFLKK